MHTYDVTIRTIYTLEETFTVQAEDEDDAVEVAAVESEWDWSNAEEHNEVLAVVKK